MSEDAKPPKLPYGITPGQFAKIKELYTDPNWKAFTEIIDTLSKLHTEDLLSSTDDHAKSFYQGFVLGLRKSRDIVGEIVNTAERKNVNRRKSDADRRKRRVAREHISTFGTGWFGR